MTSPFTALDGQQTQECRVYNTEDAAHNPTRRWGPAQIRFMTRDTPPAATGDNSIRNCVQAFFKGFSQTFGDFSSRDFNVANYVISALAIDVTYLCCLGHSQSGGQSADTVKGPPNTQDSHNVDDSHHQVCNDANLDEMLREMGITDARKIYVTYAAVGGVFPLTTVWLGTIGMLNKTQGIIAFRGTISSKDWAADVEIEPKPFVYCANHSEPIPGNTHTSTVCGGRNSVPVPGFDAANATVHFKMNELYADAFVVDDHPGPAGKSDHANRTYSFATEDPSPIYDYSRFASGLVDPPGQRIAAQTILECLRGYSADVSWIITGHSLGAGIADLCAAQLATAGVKIHSVYLFADPQPGNENYTTTFNKLSTNVDKLTLGDVTYNMANVYDVVPGLVQKASISHVDQPGNVKRFVGPGSKGGVSELALAHDMDRAYLDYGLPQLFPDIFCSKCTMMTDPTYKIPVYMANGEVASIQLPTENCAASNAAPSPAPSASASAARANRVILRRDRDEVFVSQGPPPTVTILLCVLCIVVVSSVAFFTYCIARGRRSKAQFRTDSRRSA